MKEKNIESVSGSSSTSVGTSSGTCNTIFNHWLPPELINCYESGESVEFVYKETSAITYTAYDGYPKELQPPQERVFKIVFSCQNGKWHKSERIYGKIIPASNEYYEFSE